MHFFSWRSAALADGAPCPPSSVVNAACNYAQGRCGCVQCDPGDAGADAASGGAASAWHCRAWSDVAPGCPETRPVVGTLCDTLDQRCDYRDECRATGVGGVFECDGREWRPAELTPDMECRTPACGAR